MAHARAADAHEGGFAECQVDPMLEPIAPTGAFRALLLGMACAGATIDRLTRCCRSIRGDLQLQ